MVPQSSQPRLCVINFSEAGIGVFLEIGWNFEETFMPPFFSVIKF
jgi:hypothetical protein